MFRFTLAIRQSFSTFHVTFIKIINVDKNNKRVLLKFFVNVANVYYIYESNKSGSITEKT